MATEKSQAIALIEQLPETVSTETIITELQFRLMVLRRGLDGERGENLLSHDEAKERLERWLTSQATRDLARTSCRGNPTGLSSFPQREGAGG